MGGWWLSSTLAEPVRSFSVKMWLLGLGAASPPLHPFACSTGDPAYAKHVLYHRATSLAHISVSKVVPFESLRVGSPDDRDKCL